MLLRVASGFFWGRHDSLDAVSFAFFARRFSIIPFQVGAFSGYSPKGKAGKNRSKKKLLGILVTFFCQVDILLLGNLPRAWQ